MRKPLIAGNWKMNKTPQESKEFVQKLADFDLDSNVEALICAPFVDLVTLKEHLKNETVSIGAQNVYTALSGAFTGEVSTLMLNEIGVQYVIIGHSERREIFGESDAFINEKVKTVLKAGLLPILCCGETLEEREKGQAFSKVENQLTEDFKGLDKSEAEKVVIAYEPIWAIGTGKTASSDDAEEMCSYIRKHIEKLYDEETASKVRIQYGGSVKPDNVSDIMSKENIDGALVGGASLEVENFVKLINFRK